jgi:predicted transposase/invertase (TIGR01784 family)
MGQAISGLEELSHDEGMRRLAEAREKAQLDELARINTAQRIGREEGKLEDARAMVADGLTLEKIMKYTGLPIEELERLSSK